MNRSYSQNAPFDKMKTRHRFRPFWGVQESLMMIPDTASVKMHQIDVGDGSKGTGVGALGHRVENEDEVGGTKIRSGKGKKGSPTHPSITGLVNSSF
jgi:hypothetical protein